METKIITKKPLLNTDLEATRTAVLSNPENLVQLCESLANCTRWIHASYLFVNYYGLQALQAICKSLTSTQSKMISNWRDLGAKLGLSYQQIMAIPNSMYPGGDCTYMTLLAFAQHPDSTIETIIRALHKIDRHDAICSAKPFLEDLARNLSENHIPGNYTVNSDYFLHNEVTDSVVRPKDYTRLYEQLPITLKDIQALEQCIKFKTSLAQNEIFQRRSLIEPLQNETLQRSSHIEPSNVPRQSQKYSRTVMLTFASDGEAVARKIAAFLRTNSSNDSWPIGVLLLSDHQEKVESNPEQFILDLFPKMDFIVPILTEEYVKMLRFRGLRSMPSGCIDCRYVPFIHDLMTKYYVSNSCKNKKIRCIIPDKYVSNIVNSPQFCNDPTLQVYEKESQINLLAERILNANI